MKVLLIHPESVEDDSYKSYAPPLGLLYVAAVLLENNHEVEFIECEHEDDSLKSVKHLINSFSPDFIGISAMTFTIKQSIEMASFIKSIDSSVKVVLGGVHGTYFPQRILQEFQAIDCVVIGEGEYSFLEIVESEMPNEEIRGIAFRSSGNIVVNEDREPIADLDKIPFPARYLSDKYTYVYRSGYMEFSHLEKESNKICTIITSRGCPCKCKYCASSSFFCKSLRYRSAKNVLDEISHLLENGYRRFLITDDHFTSNLPRLREICIGLIELKKTYSIQWGCMGRMGSDMGDAFELMAKAGCAHMLIGIESGSKKVLDYYNKKLNITKIHENLKKAKKNNLDIVATLIVGAPIETFDDIKQTSKLVNSLDVDVINISRLAVFPGTLLWQELVGNECINEESDWNESIFTGDIIPHFTSRLLYDWAKYIERRFYFRPKYIARQIPRMVKRVFRYLGGSN